MKLILTVMIIGSLHFSYHQPNPFKPISVPDTRTLFRTEQVIFPANTPAVLKTGINVNKTDYVYFEAIGRINLGIMTPNVDAGGSQKPNLIALYNRKRLPDKWAHGRLYCLNGNEPDLEPVGVYNYFENIAAIVLNNREIRANSFIAKSDMELSFILNDKQTQDNSGSFIINIVIIPYEAHRTRNRYNQCPLYEPKDLAGYKPKSSAIDFTGMEWKLSITERHYHSPDYIGPDVYHSYRGESSSIKGCQCVYDPQGKLVDDEYLGTFDFAFGQYRNHRLLYQQLTEWQHVAWDVWPHDRYVEYFRESFKYEPTPPKNIYF